MAILFLKILALWSLIACAAGLGVGQIIQRGERARKEEILTAVFASAELLQSDRA